MNVFQDIVISVTKILFFLPKRIADPKLVYYNYQQNFVISNGLWKPQMKNFKWVTKFCQVNATIITALSDSY